MSQVRTIVHLLSASLPLLALPLAACSTGERIEVKARPIPARYSSPIVGGTIDNGHPQVALIYNNVEGYVCTGSVIDPMVVLTAGHCVEDTDPTHYQVAGGTDPFTNGADWLTGATEIAAHPGYDPNDIGVRDVGIIVLDDVAPVTPLAWQETVNDAVYATGTPFTAVGYGITSGTANDEGIKRKVNMTIRTPYLDAFEYGDATKNSCSGDSGGPAIASVGGVDTVIGVVSFGDQNCQQYGFDMRTDYNAAFIASYMGSGNPPTPTPTQSGTPTPNPTNTPGGDDDDDGTSNPGDPDEGHGLFACSVTAGTTGAAMLPCLALAGLLFAATRRRR